MAKFKQKGPEFEATQWFKNGDHPDDGPNPNVEGKVVRRFNHPDFPGVSLCEQCGKPYQAHGHIERGGQKVCPGDWVVTGPKGEYSDWKPADFNRAFDAA